MAERPRATVTFLFTDVEGSTRLLKQLGERYGAVLGEHGRIVRGAVAAHGGEVVDTQGDAFFCVFPRAHDAAEAAAAAQRALAAHPWPDEGELRVRMGMHTGEPNVTEDNRYHGLGVHRAARIVAVGHGGQVLASQATAAVLEDDEPAGVHLRYLGEYPLKDLDRPERIYQLEIDGLPQTFPRLTVAPARPSTWGAALRRRRGVALAGACLAAVVVVVAALAIGLGGTAQALSQVDANALGFVAAESGEISGQVEVGATPTHVAVGEGAIWVANTDGDTVSRIDPATKAVVQTIEVGSSPEGITTGNGAVWVANGLDSSVSRIDPATDTVVQQIPVGNGPVGIVYAAGSIWVANTGDQTITQIDAASGRPERTLSIPATELAFGAGTIWASQQAASRVTRIDPRTGREVVGVTVGNGPSGIAFGRGAAWVANSLDGTISRIDPARNAVASVISVGNGPRSIAVDERGVWVSNQFDGSLVRVDPRRHQVAQRVEVGNRPQGIALRGKDVLVGVRQSGVGHRGGTLRVLLNRRTDSLDTALAYDSVSWSILRMTGDGLVAFNAASGLQGTQLVPDLALALPAPTDGGRTYTFRLRPGVRFSSGRPVKASDFRTTFERQYALGPPVAPHYGGIVGAARCVRTKRSCDLSRGIAADDAARTVTFHLVAPDPEFLNKLALPFAYVVPAGTRLGPGATGPLPATGPYVIETYRPARLIRLVRNPHFHEWSKAAQPDGYPDEIDFRIGGTPDAAVNDVLRGEADVFSTAQSETPPSEGVLAMARTRYASQVHTNPQPATIALFLNTTVPPFDRLEARRALNFAADRAAAAAAVGGPDVAQPTCQILPPNFPGYRPYCPYTAGSGADGRWTGPDLSRARALVAASGTRGMKVTFWSWEELGQIGPYAVKLLRSLGYRASIKPLDTAHYWVAVNDSRTRAQIGTNEWISDYPTAAGFFEPVLTCRLLVPNTPNNGNDAQFCNAAVDRRTAQAEAAESTNPEAARRLWESVDRLAVDQAPWVPLVNPRVVDVLSKRVGDYQSSPPLGVLFSQLWVR